MTFKSLKTILFKLHRWIGVGLAPLFLLIALSGGALAMKPMQTTPETPPGESVSSAQLIGFLNQLDPLGEEVDALSVDAASGQVNLRSQNPELAGRFDLASGERSDDFEAVESFDLFEFAEHLHKELLVGADIVIQIASYLMLLMVIAAPLLAWPLLRNNLRGWHRSVGWLLLPLVVMLPLTGVLMSLHVGMPELPRMSQPGLRLSLAQALQSAQQESDLSTLNSIRRFRGGSVMIGLRDTAGERRLVVTDQSVTALDPQNNLVKSLHEGTWGGPLSGALNLLGAGTLSVLTLTGFISWQRRRRKRRELQERRRAAEAMA